MKSKKLIAIVTLVMFMMMLVPVAAFAAPDRFATVVSGDKTSATANGTDKITYTVYTYDASYNLLPGETVYFASSRGTTDVFKVNDLAATSVTTAAVTAKGEVKLTSGVPGTARIAFGTASAATLKDYLDGGSTAPSAAAAGIIKVFDVTFTAPAADNFTAIATAGNGNAVTGTGVDSANAYQAVGINGNSVDYFEISYTLRAENNAPVSGSTVEITGSKTELAFNKTSITTDAAGVAKVKVYASKPGTYSVKATTGDVTKTVYVKFASNDAFNIELVSAANQVVARDADFELKFKILDANGNKITVPTTFVDQSADSVDTTYGLKFEATTRPSGAAMDEKIYDSTDTADYICKGDDDGYLRLKIKADELDTEGDYVIKAYFDSGRSVVVPFSVKKQGTITKITIAYDQVSVPINTFVGAPTVKRYDAAGVSKTVTTNLTFVASDVTKVASFDATAGSFTTVNDDKYAGTFTITVVDTDKNLTAFTTMTVAKQASGITLAAPAAATAVGTDASVDLQVVDVDGKAVSISNASAVSADIYVISKPTGAIVSSSTATGILSEIKKTGKTTIKIGSNTAGDVAVQVVLNVTTPAGDSKYTASAALKFGAVQVAIGAKNVTMFIGATGYVQDGVAKVTDVAPFIKDSRTFVAVRPIADAFGATIGWNEATGTVTLTRSDMTLTIVIGQAAITKVAGGVTSTITADVPAFIKDGRTVLPFRAVGEAFGATVSYDAATQAVTFNQL